MKLIYMSFKFKMHSRNALKIYFRFSASGRSSRDTWRMRHKPENTHTTRRPDSWHTPDNRQRAWQRPARNRPLLLHNSLARRPAAEASPGSEPLAMQAGRIIDTFEISAYCISVEMAVCIRNVCTHH